MIQPFEIWRPVIGFEGDYEVSDQGRVRSLDRILSYERPHRLTGEPIFVARRHRGKLLRPGTCSTGHLTVVLGRGNTRSVHILVLEAFVGPCPDGMECCHGNDVPSNNWLANLRWGTRSDNLNDAVRNGRKATGERTYMAKLKNADIPIIRAQFGKQSFSSLARQYAVNESTIRQIKDGKSWSNH